jgi:2-methylcitrate dehydratase PrpD
MNQSGRSTLTRRAALQSVCGVTVAALAPARRLLAAEPISPVMTTLSTYMSQAKDHDLPAEVIEKAKHHILDSLAAMVSGAELLPGKTAIRFAAAHPGDKVATVAGSKVLCGAADAALANGILAHSDETDDYAPLGTHPGAALVPAALALAEPGGSDGTRFLRAVTLGYDIANRVAVTLGGLTLNYEGHKSIHTVSGLFGASAAAGSVAGLNVQQTRWLLDYTAQQASGIAAWQRDTDHIEKAFVYAGLPARGGVTGVELVQAGATGVDDVLSGSDNFLLAWAPKADPQILIDKLGERYEITRTTIKKWTVGGPIQAPLDALQMILKRHPFEAAQVQKVIVRLGPGSGSIVDNREMPDICVQHMVAVMLLDKTASFKAAHDKPRMQDPVVLRQRAKVQLVPDPELERNTAQREAIVEVTLTDGTQLKERVAAVKGTVANPMTREEVAAKARDLLTPVVGASNGEKLIDAIWALESVKDIRQLRPFLQPA